ncbi:MAG: hypothetical protein IJQ21_10700 [Lachnospiraceae bacterium]|nr:hypothetical protein [Lachnospiraceae bacterium]
MKEVDTKMQEKWNVTAEEERMIRQKLSMLFISKKERNSLIALAIILVIGWGPGELIADQAVLVAGVPMLWLWWICWWVVWVIAMYTLIFKCGQIEFED